MSEDTATKGKIRLLYCQDCRTLEELPDFDGPAEYDTLLEIALSKHETNGHRHVGKLFDVEQKVWNLSNLRNTIIDQIKGDGSKGLAISDATFYDVKNQFKEDALKCYSLHMRPKEGCPDYRADSKILLPDTKAERKAAGLAKPKRGTAPVQWLCQHCPVDAWYAKKRRGD